MTVSQIDNQFDFISDSFALSIMGILGAILCTFSGWITNIYIVQPEDILLVFWDTTKAWALFGAVMTGLSAVLTGPNGWHGLIVPPLVFVYFTLLVPISSLVAWIVWRLIWFLVN